MSEEKKEANIKLVRLLSGEDIVADVEVDQGSSGLIYKLTNPITVAVVGTGAGQKPQAVCQPWLLFSTDNFVKLHERFVMYTTDPVEQFYQQWKKIFEPSAIITPEEKKIIVPNA